MSDQADPQKTVEAAREFVWIALAKLADERGIHAETVIAGVSRMAGTFLFRSFGFTLKDAKPGQAVLSEIANEQGPRLINIAGSALAGVGIHPDLNKLTDEMRTGHEPLMAFLETQKRLEPAFNEVRERLGIALPQAADAAALATAMLIQQSREVLSPDLAFDIAAYGFIEGTKTIPGEI